MESLTNKIQRLQYALLSLIVGLLVVACNEPEIKHNSGGWIEHQSQRYTLAHGRVGNHLANEDGTNVINLQFGEQTLIQNGITTSGTGALLDIWLMSECDTICDGIYTVVDDNETLCNNGADSIVFTVIPKKEGDTITVEATRGYIDVQSNDWGRVINFHLSTANGDSIVGQYTGKLSYNTHFDAPSVGTLSIDTIKIDLQRANVVNWGIMFTDQANYYEYYFYSTDMRHTDNGKIYSGTMLVIGLHSFDLPHPASGTYPISKGNDNHTALYGHKSGSTYWGCYWVRYTNGNSSARSNIMKDMLTLEVQEDGTCQFNFALTDQSGNSVSGNYHDLVTPRAQQ